MVSSSKFKDMSKIWFTENQWLDLFNIGFVENINITFRYIDNKVPVLLYK